MCAFTNHQKFTKNWCSREFQQILFCQFLCCVTQIVCALRSRHTLALRSPPADAPHAPHAVRFEPAGAFAGARPGMVFKMGEQGLGYYTDTAASAGAAARPPAAVTAVTVDHSRTVVRVQSTPVRASATLAAGVRCTSTLHGSARVAVEPLDEPCSRRACTAWRWSAPKRAAATPS